MSQLIGLWTALAWTALQAALLFLVVTGLRLSQRRLLAELNTFDLVVTVAAGAIMGRTATSSSTAFLTGAGARRTLPVLCRRSVTARQRRGWFGGLLNRRHLVLLKTGRLQAEGLQAVRLTHRKDLRLLRQAGQDDLEGPDYVLCEEGGALKIVRANGRRGETIQAGRVSEFARIVVAGTAGMSWHFT